MTQARWAISPCRFLEFIVEIIDTAAEDSIWNIESLTRSQLSNLEVYYSKTTKSRGARGGVNARSYEKIITSRQPTIRLKRFQDKVVELRDVLFEESHLKQIDALNDNRDGVLCTLNGAEPDGAARESSSTELASLFTDEEAPGYLSISDMFGVGNNIYEDRGLESNSVGSLCHYGENYYNSCGLLFGFLDGYLLEETGGNGLPQALPGGSLTEDSEVGVSVGASRCIERRNQLRKMNEVHIEIVNSPDSNLTSSYVTVESVEATRVSSPETAQDDVLNSVGPHMDAVCVRWRV